MLSCLTTSLMGAMWLCLLYVTSQCDVEDNDDGVFVRLPYPYFVYGLAFDKYN